MSAPGTELLREHIFMEGLEQRAHEPGQLFPRLIISRDEMAAAGLMPGTPRDMRAYALSRWPGTMLLSERAKADYIAGKCALREYRGMPIVDYSIKERP